MRHKGLRCSVRKMMLYQDEVVMVRHEGLLERNCNNCTLSSEGETQRVKV